MPLQNQLIPQTTVTPRFRRKSSSSDCSAPDFIAQFCTRSMNPHSQHRHLSEKSAENSEAVPTADFSHHAIAPSSYPSPPSSNPQVGGYLSFPSIVKRDLYLRNFTLPINPPYQYGGTLDSPPFLFHPLIQYQNPAHLPSPPWTVQKSPLTLPLSRIDPSPLSEIRDFSEPEDGAGLQSPEFGTCPPSSRSSISTLQSPPLSPISPNSVFFPVPTFLHPDVELPDNALYPISDSLLCGQDPKDDVTIHHPPLSLLKTQDSNVIDLEPLFSNHFIFESPPPIEQELEPIYLNDHGRLLPPLRFEKSNFEDDLHRPFTDYSAHAALPDQPPSHDVTTPSPLLPHYHSARSSFFDYDETDFSDTNPPSSPSRRSCSALPELSHDDHDRAKPDFSASNSHMDNDFAMLPPPASPSLTLLSLPGADADEDLISLDPPPPSVTDQIHTGILSPTRLLVIDDDSTPRSSSSGGPNHRSPSPEPCLSLDLNLLASQILEDEELQKVCMLIQSTKNEESVARGMESLVGEEERVVSGISGVGSASFEGSVAAAEALEKLVESRRRTKKAKRKVREVATLLRLKLEQRGLEVVLDGSGKPMVVPMAPTPTPVVSDEDAMDVDSSMSSGGGGHQRHRIRSTNQLLAKMLMDRHESMYNPSLKAGPPSNRRAVSPLAKPSKSARQGGDDDGACEGDIPNTPIPDVLMQDVDVKGDLGDTEVNKFEDFNSDLPLQL